MLRYIKWAILIVIAVVLASMALANREMVTLNLLPAEMVEFFGFLQPFAFSVQLPLFLVVALGVVLGLVIGYIIEYLREYHHRAEAARKKAEVKRLERELKRTQAERDKDKDEVLALLDQAS